MYEGKDHLAHSLLELVAFPLHPYVATAGDQVLKHFQYDLEQQSSCSYC